MQRFTIRISEKLLWKLRIIAEREVRSVNKLLSLFLRDAIEAYEAKHGEIKL